MIFYQDDDYGPDLIPAPIDDNLELPPHLGNTQSQRVLRPVRPLDHRLGWLEQLAVEPQA